jgi:hypothetical protein
MKAIESIRESGVEAYADSKFKELFCTGIFYNHERRNCQGKTDDGQYA